MQFDYILSDYDTIMGAMARREFARRGLVPRVVNGNLTAPFAAAMALAGLGPVSYTHLDVYKRQAVPSTDLPTASIP